ncbi:hypothetical protein JCM1393_02470 [Clostridium carnis]
MKKLLTILSIFIMCFSFSTVAFASSIEELEYVKDVVVPNGQDGVITTTIKGTTDSEGVLRIPCYKNADIKKIDIKTGKLIEELKKEKNGSLEYYIAKFEEKEDKVELVISQAQKNTFEINASKQKDTFPGNVKMVTYKMTNNTPVEIEKYALEMAIPEEYELYNIVGYNPEKAYSMFSKDGSKYGAFEFGKLSAGKESKFSINIYKTGKSFTFILWGVVVLISSFFMYKNKEMLKQAKELTKEKKANTVK